MASTTGIAWCDASANFWIGCTHCGPGCGELVNGKMVGCYAADLAARRFGITFGAGQPRRKTKAGYTSPVRWNAWHRQGRTHMRVKGKMEKIPKWIFACSLADFFDNEVDPAWRVEAWRIIKATPYLRWQIVTKRVGNVLKMLPDDWNGGKGYEHVGIIATMVSQAEVNRDWRKLQTLKQRHGVRWIGLSIEPQIGPVDLTRVIREEEDTAYVDNALTGFNATKAGGWHDAKLDWVITGGESNQGEHKARPYDLAWTRSLVVQCAEANVPCFVKQMGDNPRFNGAAQDFKGKGDDPRAWPAEIRVQQMPRIYDDVPLAPTAGTDLLAEIT